MFYDSSWFVYVLPFVMLASLASLYINKTYSKYLRVNSGLGLTGKEMAEKILRDNNIYDVKIGMVNGTLSDHYNPTTKTLNLSKNNYYDNSVSAISVAAHECGHAIQHNVGYSPLKIRAAIVPVVNFGSRFSGILIILGMLFETLGPSFIEIGIALFSFSVIFQLITLPVEFNASRRALGEISAIGSKATIKGSKKVLTAAALTYVAGTLVAIGQFLRLLSITENKRNDN